MKNGRLLRIMVIAAWCAVPMTHAADVPQKNDTQAAAAPAAGLAPIDLKLPDPYFGGTPLDYKSPNFEELSPIPRAPFLAPKDAVVLSKDKPVTSSCANPTYGKLTMITDGEKGYEPEHVVELPRGKQWVQIDLGQECEIYAVVVWHFHSAERVYFDVVVRAADDADCMKNVQTLYNNDADNSSGFGIGKDNEYVDTREGRLISALKDGKGAQGRYVRLHSNGNTTDETNHYIEVEVWGKPLAK